MAWEGSDRRARLPGDWAVRRMRVLRRDGYRCQARDSRDIACEQPANQVDHIARDDDHDYANLRALCRWHHDRKSASEGVSARRPRATMRRPSEGHPGLVS